MAATEIKKTGGKSFVFGCTLVGATNSCRFAKAFRTNTKQVILLQNQSEEPILLLQLNELSDWVSRKLFFGFPLCFSIMSDPLNDCFLGTDNIPKVIKAVTVACDYCAHPHVDANNVLGGYTVVLSLLKPDGVDKSFHVLLDYLPEDELTEEIGGIGFDLPTGSLLYECARVKSHATTKLRNPDRFLPERMSVVFYTHPSLLQQNHGKIKDSKYC